MTQALGTLRTFEAHLRDPWDAAWLAKHYPEIFTLKSDALGIIEIRDLEAAFALKGQQVHVIDDETGFMLSVNGITQPLMWA